MPLKVDEIEINSMTTEEFKGKYPGFEDIEVINEPKEGQKEALEKIRVAVPSWDAEHVRVGDFLNDLVGGSDFWEPKMIILVTHAFALNAFHQAFEIKKESKIEYCSVSAISISNTNTTPLFNNILPWKSE